MQAFVLALGTVESTGACNHNLDGGLGRVVAVMTYLDPVRGIIKPNVKLSLRSCILQCPGIAPMQPF
jgi:hypothetical protein